MLVWEKRNLDTQKVHLWFTEIAKSMYIYLKENQQIKLCLQPYMCKQFSYSLLNWLIFRIIFW